MVNELVRRYASYVPNEDPLEREKERPTDGIGAHILYLVL